MLSFWSTLGITMCFAYVMYLLIEAPFGGLGNFLVPKRTNPPLEKQKSQIDENEEKNPEELKVNTPPPPAY